MLQQINKTKLYFYIFALFFLTTFFNNNNLFFIDKLFLVKNFKVNTEIPELNNMVLNKIYFLKDKNVFQIDNNFLFEKLNELTFLQDIEIKKKYPSTIIINAKKTKIKAITFKDKRKYFIGENGRYISSDITNNSFKLPTVFGHFPINEYLNLNKILQKADVNIKNIEKYYYHKNKRWDLYLKNKIIIKLPNQNVGEAIKIYNRLKNLNKIGYKTTIDLRIPNMVILKNG